LATVVTQTCLNVRFFLVYRQRC